MEIKVLVLVSSASCHYDSITVFHQTDLKILPYLSKSLIMTKSFFFKERGEKARI